MMTTSIVDVCIYIFYSYFIEYSTVDSTCRNGFSNGFISIFTICLQIVDVIMMSRA